MPNTFERVAHVGGLPLNTKIGGQNGDASAVAVDCPTYAKILGVIL